jgi:3-oxoacyl-[acyl-carrier protein] reductase
VASSPPRLRALVTGASRGIGRAIAQQLAARGCRVGVHFHQNRAAADATLTTLSGDGHARFAADMARADELARLWRDATQEFGRVDIVVNSAAVFSEHPALDTSFDAWREAWHQTIATNLVGPALLCHLAAAAMAGSSADATPAPEEFPAGFGRGRIVNISSRGAFRGEPRSPAYGASKAGLNSLSQSLAKALAPQAVYVFCLAPGWVDTEMAAEYLHGSRRDDILGQEPLGRVATADEIARAAVFCALDAPPVMTGCILDLNGASYLRT